MEIVPEANKVGRPPRAFQASVWAPVYLAEYRKTGSSELAAETAGISPKTVRKYRLAHPKFARAVKRARRYFAESMEYELVKQARGESKGSFLATIARLKATRRKMLERYSEKVADQRALTLTVNYNTAIGEIDARAMLARGLAQVTPATLALLTRSEATPEEAVIEPAKEGT